MAVRHSDRATLMMRVNEFEHVLFAQHHVLIISITRDPENVITALSRNCRRKGFQNLHGNLHFGVTAVGVK